MTRLVYALLLGIVGAGIVHIVVLLLVPSYSQRDAWSTLAARDELYGLVRLDAPGAAPVIGSLDPLFGAAACRFDLQDGVLRVWGEGAVPYWSISVYDRTGQNVFSFNDRSSSDGRLDFVVASPIQMIELRNAMPIEFERSVFVEAALGEGIVVVRAFAPDESWSPTVTAYLQGIACAPY